MITTLQTNDYNKKQNSLNVKVKSLKLQTSGTKAQISKDKIVLKQYIEEMRNKAITQAFFSGNKDIIEKTEQQIQYLMSKNNITNEDLKQMDVEDNNFKDDDSVDYEEDIEEEQKEKKVNDNINKEQSIKREQEIKQRNIERREKLKENMINRRKELLDRKNKHNYSNYDEYILNKEFENKKSILVKKIKQAREEANKTKNKEIISQMEQEIKKLLLKNHMTADDFYKNINDLTEKEKQQHWKDFESKYIDNEQQRYLANEIYKIRRRTIETEEQEVNEAIESQVERMLAKYNRKHNKNITEDDLIYNSDNNAIKDYLKGEIEKMRNSALNSRNEKNIRITEKKIKLMIVWYGVGEENNLYRKNYNELILTVLPTNNNQSTALETQLKKLSIIKEIERLRIISFDSGKIEEVKIVVEQIKELMMRYNIKEENLQGDNNIKGEILKIQRNIEQNGTTDEEVVEANKKIVELMEENNRQQKENIKQETKQEIENMRAKASYIGNKEYITETENKIKQILLNKNLTKQDLI